MTAETQTHPSAQVHRLGAKLHQAVARLDLDLSGVTVLTEAATGPYVVTAVLAALAGAKVHALAKSSRYGSVADVREQTAELVSTLGLTADRVDVVDEVTSELVAAADVITNSGHLRPLDASSLRFAKDSVVVPLMYEAWEWRAGDLDLDYARSRGIRVGATNERHPDVGVFDYLGEMAVKLIHDAGLSLRNHRFMLVTNNHFGPYIARTLVNLCQGLAVVDLDEHKARYAGIPVDWMGGFPRVGLPTGYDDCEAVILAAYPFDRCWVGQSSDIALSVLESDAVTPVVLRYAGDIDGEHLDRVGITYFPKHVPSGHMGVLPSAIGDDPIIRLQSGGLKAAEAMLTGQHLLHGLPILEML